MRDDRRTHLATLAVLLLVFGAGIAVGFVLDGPAMQAAAPAEESDRGEAGRDRGDDERRDPPRRRWIIDRVDLDPAQRLRVDSVLEFYRERMSEEAEEYQRSFRGTVAETRAAIRAILNDEQRARYDSLLAENDERRSRSSSGGSDRER